MVDRLNVEVSRNLRGALTGSFVKSSLYVGTAFSDSLGVLWLCILMLATDAAALVG